MQKLYVLILSLIAQLLPSAAQAQTQNSKSLLWKISGKQLHQASYLFGTIHSICQDDYFFTDAMKKAFANSRKLILEVDLSDPNMIAQYQQHLMLPEGKVLSDFFSNPQEYRNFSDKVKNDYGIETEQFSRFKPFLLISMISMKQFSCEQQASYEMNLLQESGQRKLEVLGLESSLSQLEIFDRMKDEDIRNMLTESVKSTKEGQEESEAMIRHYKSQDIDALYKLIVSSPEFREHETELISGRNIKWMNTLLNEMSHQTCFIAVGAGHLGGEKGLLSLLRQAGYTVEPQE